MRTIETNLYEFSELTDEAQQYAIKHLRHEAFESMSATDWEDANRAIKRVKCIASIECEIQQNSQGFYTRWVKDETAFDVKDSDNFFMFKDCIKTKFHADDWAEDMLQGIVLDTEYDNRYSYSHNVCNILIRFCEQVYNNTLDYYDDINVIEYIQMNDMEFTANGRPYRNI